MRRGIADKADGHLGKLDRGGVAIIRPFVQGDRRSLGPGAERIGSGADRLRRIGRRTLRLNDRAARLPQQEWQVRFGIFEHDHDGLRIGRGDLLKRLVQALVLVGAGRRGVAIKGELYRRGIERLAVMEFDALAELECIGLQVGRRLPTLGEQGRHRTVLVDLGQRLIEVIERNLGDRCGGRVGGIEPRRLQRHAHDDAVLLALREARQRRHGERGGHRDNGHFFQHVTPPKYSQTI